MAAKNKLTVEDQLLAKLRDASRLNEQNRRIFQAREKELEQALADASAANKFLLHIDKPVKPKPIAVPKKKGKLPSATYVMAASDWHVGERVRPEQIGFRNEYNPDIAQERAERYFISNLIMLNGSRAKWDIDTAVWWLGGDLMTGYIHEEYESENYLSPLEEADLLLDILARGLRFMLEKYNLKRIIIPTSSGNHGRTHKKKRIQSDFRNSYEFFVYQRLMKEFSNEPRVEFRLGTGYHNEIDIYGFRLRCSHGDAIKSGGGVGGLAPPAYRRIGRMQESGHAVDLDMIGHFHQANFMRRFFINGCFAAGTKICVPGGVRSIEEIQIGSSVISRDGSIQIVENITNRCASEGTVSLRAKGLPVPITCTPNHEIWAIKGDSRNALRKDKECRKSVPSKQGKRWIPAGDLSIGDWVHSPVLAGTKREDLDLLWVYGLFLAEGHTIVEGGASKKHFRIEFTMHIDEEGVLKRAKSILDSHLNLSGRLSTRPKKTTSSLSYSGENLARSWRDRFGHTSHGKKVPAEFYDLNDESRAALVQGWFDGDGHVGPCMTAVSVSEQLAWGMYVLACGTKFEPMLYIQSHRPGGLTGRSESWRVSFVKGQDVAWVDGERFLRIDYRQFSEATIPVFDLQVSGEHTYIAGGIGVHNSLIGWNNFADFIGAAPEPPQQISFVIDAEHKVPSDMNAIFVTPRKVK